MNLNVIELGFLTEESVNSSHLAIFPPNLSHFVYFIRSKTLDHMVDSHMRQHKKALALKEKGNDAFKRKEYEIAEKFYTEGIDEIFIKFSIESRRLWTNRAICRNILGKHEDALGDCQFALFIDPKCTKAGFQSEC